MFVHYLTVHPHPSTRHVYRTAVVDNYLSYRLFPTRITMNITCVRLIIYFSWCLYGFLLSAVFQSHITYMHICFSYRLFPTRITIVRPNTYELLPPTTTDGPPPALFKQAFISFSFGRSTAKFLMS